EPRCVGPGGCCRGVVGDPTPRFKLENLVSDFCCGQCVSFCAQCEMSTPVLLPALLGRFCAERFLFAIAHHFNAVCVDAESHKLFLDGLHTAVSESQVVLSGAALVTMSFKHDFDIGMLAQELRIRSNALGLSRLNGIAVIVKKDVLDVL